MTKFFAMLILVCITVPVQAEYQFAPIIGLKYVDAGGQTERSLHSVLVLMRGEDSPETIDDVDSLLTAVSYSNYRYRTGEFHSAALYFNKQAKRHEILIVAYSSAKRLFSNIYDFNAGAFYGWRISHSPEFSLVLGGGLMAGDTGFEYNGGDAWPVIPLPMVKSTYDNDIISADFDFIGSSSLSFTVGPNNIIRFNGELSARRYERIEDLVFDAAIEYRPFYDDADKDYFGFSIGVHNNSNSFTMGEKKTSYYFNYYSAYAEIDLSCLVLSGGYVFNVNEINHMDKVTVREEFDDGYFVSATLMYLF